MAVYEYLMVAVVALTTPVYSFDCLTRTGEAGQCSSIRQCPDMFKLLQRIQSNTAPPGSLQLIRDSVCKSSDGVILVCCKQEEHVDVLVTRAASVLPSDCGRSIFVDRIVGGVDASLFAWPWMALLRSRSAARGSSWTCGGVLISSRYVLTAAHCVQGHQRISLEYVRVGEHQLGRNPDCERRVCAPSPQDITVEEVIVHEGYQGVKNCPKCHDIALIRLATPATLNTAYVVPLCLPLDLESNLGITTDEITGFGWTAGWGTLDPTRTVPAGVLQEVFLPIKKTFCDLSRYPDPNMVLCAGGEGVDSCGGDSGGPLTMENSGNSRNYLVGLVSNGPTICGAPRTQGVYTNVHYYVPWILKHLRQ